MGTDTDYGERYLFTDGGRMKTKIESYIYGHAVALHGDDSSFAQGAALSQVTGPAFTIMTDEKKPKILGCGGVRVQGIGEAWAFYDKEALKDFPKILLPTTRQVLNDIIAQERLIRIYAEASVSETWLEHLGFKKQENIFAR